MASLDNGIRALWVRAAQQGVMVAKLGAAALCLSALMACSPAPSNQASATTAPATVGTDPVPPAATPPPAADARTVLVFGDSLSAAYNLAAEQGWVALADARLRAEAPGFRMVNASISGETTGGGVARIDTALAEHRPALVILALGANDGLRGLPLEEIRANLVRMVRASKAAGAEVLLVGMQLPPNYGPDYTAGFFALFGEVAKAEDVGYLPFLLEPIAFDDAAFQSDRLHPTAEAQAAIANHVWQALAPMLNTYAARRTGTTAG